VLEQQLDNMRAENVAAAAAQLEAEENLERERLRLAEVDSREENKALKRRVEELEGEVRDKGRQMRERGALCEELRSEVEAQSHHLTQVQAQLDAQVDDSKRDVSAMSAIDAENQKLTQDLMMLKEVDKGQRRTFEAREERVRTLQRDLAAAEARAEAAERKVALSKDLEKINVKEFESLMSSNLQVAHSIHSLMQNLPQQDQPTAAAPLPSRPPSSANGRRIDAAARAGRRSKTPERSGNSDELSDDDGPHSPHMPDVTVESPDGEVSRAIAQYLTQLWEQLDYLDEHKEGTVTVDELLGELEGLQIFANAQQLGLPDDPEARVNWREFLHRYNAMRNPSRRTPRRVWR